MTVSRSYRRVVLKISGESLGTISAEDPGTFKKVANAIASIRAKGVDVAVVVGGGNLFRGDQAGAWGMAPAAADEVGMIATGVNALLLRAALEVQGIGAFVVSRGPCTGIGHPYDRDAAMNALASGRVVILAGGLGISGVSTDVPAVHLAVELDAPVVIMSKHGVDGIYDADPNVCSAARFLPVVSASEAIRAGLRVMDTTAMQLALEHGRSIHVIPADDDGALERAVQGLQVGSKVEPR